MLVARYLPLARAHNTMIQLDQYLTIIVKSIRVKSPGARR